MASAVGETCVVWVSTANYNEKNKKKSQSWHIRKVKYYTSKEIAWS